MNPFRGFSLCASLFAIVLVSMALGVQIERDNTGLAVIDTALLAMNLACVVWNYNNSKHA